MTCGAVQTGQRFVADALAHIDCQAQTVGSLGYQALANPTSAASIAATGLLTIFVALFGLRLMSGRTMAGGDLVGDFIKLGIVLTLATSWPAWRTVGYNLVIHGPDEIAGALTGSSDLAAPADIASRLQGIDDGIVLLTVYGTGRMTGGVNRSDSIGDSFRGIALADQEGFANGRVGFLVGTVGTLALVRLAAGLLLAIAPIMAGFLLFSGARGVFYGWLRGLGAVALGSLALRIVHGVEVAMLDPWLRDAIAQRDGRVLTPSAPTELVALSYSFALAALGMLALVVKIVFFSDLKVTRLIADAPRLPEWRPALRPAAMISADGQPPSRAFLVAQAVAQSQQREERGDGRSRTIERMGSGSVPSTMASAARSAAEPSPQLERRPQEQGRRRSRSSTSGQRRDRK